MPRPRPFVRPRLAWLIAGLMISVVAGDWTEAGEQAVEILDLLQRLNDVQGKAKVEKALSRILESDREGESQGQNEGDG